MIQTPTSNTYRQVLWLIDWVSWFWDSVVWTHSELVACWIYLMLHSVGMVDHCEHAPRCMETNSCRHFSGVSLRPCETKAIFRSQSFEKIVGPWFYLQGVLHNAFEFHSNFICCICWWTHIRRRRLSASKILQSEGSLASNWERLLFSSPKWLTDGAKRSENSVGQGCSSRRSTCIRRIIGSSNQPPKPGFVDDVTTFSTCRNLLLFFLLLMATRCRIPGRLCEKGLQHGWDHGDSSAETSLVCVACLDWALPDRPW